jgi:hypothetical protein
VAARPSCPAAHRSSYHRNVDAITLGSGSRDDEEGRVVLSRVPDTVRLARGYLKGIAAVKMRHDGPQLDVELSSRTKNN